MSPPTAGTPDGVPDIGAPWARGNKNQAHPARRSSHGATIRFDQTIRDGVVAAYADLAQLGYLTRRTDIKQSTREHLDRARLHLVAFFGADKALADITPGCADEFRLHLLKRMGDNTVRRLCGRAKQFLRAATRKRLIAQSPFGDMADTNVRENKSREFFVARDMADKVLAACPDSQWRLLFALSRYGGLRCPSEHLALTWGDVDWERGRVRIPSPKTEHHEGGDCRWIPMFPELRPYLEAVWDEAPEGTEFVITRYRQRNCNLRTQLQRIIVKAKLEPWPKLFQNLRSTRETELAESFPIHVVCAWLGNTQAVARKHYLQVTDEHFAAASDIAVQNPVRQPSAAARNRPQVEEGTSPQAPVFQELATSCEPSQFALAPRGGLNSIQASSSGEPYNSTGYVERPSSPSSPGTPFWSPNRSLNRSRKNAAIPSKLPATTSRFSIPASSRAVPHSPVTWGSAEHG